MSWTQSDLDTLNRAIVTGSRKVKFADGREVEYRTLAELRSIRDEVAAGIAPTAARVRTVVISHKR